MKQVLILIAAAIFLYSCSSETAAPDNNDNNNDNNIDYTLEIGTPAPPIEGKNPNGQTVSLSGFEGKVVVVDFWATWCSVCRATTSEVRKFYTDYQNEDIVILGVALEFSTENLGSWRDYIADKSLVWPHVEDTSRDISDDYEVIATPWVYVIGKDGNIAYKGSRNFSKITPVVDAELAK